MLKIFKEREWLNTNAIVFLGFTRGQAWMFKHKCHGHSGGPSISYILEFQQIFGFYFKIIINTFTQRQPFKKIMQ